LFLSLFFKWSKNTAFINSPRSIHSPIDNNIQNKNRNTVIEILSHHVKSSC
jgi:hypothetical protein